MPMTGKEMLQHLELHGWRLDRIQGSHHIMEKDGEPRKISVPVHGNRTLGKGLESDILKKAGLK